jgi:ubiquinone/menaquinone biosynthesis C-methylase UbiE
VKNPFDRLAERYDSWFDTGRGRRIFLAELACLRNLIKDRPPPSLEVGVGTGRFSQELDVEDGIDPSPKVLRVAAGRGINTRLGYAEDLPYAASSYGTVLMVTTICFVSNPTMALRECARVLKCHGRLIVGLCPADSPWGKAHAQRGRDGHPFYSAADFYTCRDVVNMANAEFFGLEAASSCLVEPPNATVAAYAPPSEGMEAHAGFVAMRFKLNRKLRSTRDCL